MSAHQQNTFLTWKVPGRAPEVHLDHTLIERLTVEVMRGFGVTRRRGTEMGGILLGNISRDPDPLVEVIDFVTVPCEYSQGPSYILSENDLQRFRDTLASYSGRQDLQSVGYFRSHTREGLRADTADAAPFETHFHDPLAIVLIVKPYATRAADAGIFLQENGRLVIGTSPLQFSFAPAQYVPFEESSAPEPVPQAPPPAPPRQAARADDLSQTSPRAEAPQVARDAALPLAGHSADAATARPPLELAEAPSTATPGPPSAPAVETPTRRATIVEGPVLEAPPPPAVQQKPEPLPEPERSRKYRSHEDEPPPFSFSAYQGAMREPDAARTWKAKASWVAFAISLFGFGAVAGHEYANGGIGWLTRAQSPTLRRDPLAIRLSAALQDRAILLSWDRGSDAVQAAQRAVLTVSEGGASKDIELDTAELRNGSVLYQTRGEEVSFRLALHLAPSRTLAEAIAVRPSGPPPPAVGTAAE